MEEGAPEETVPFEQVANVATAWVFDYMFAYLCHYFADDERAEDFQRTCRAMEVILDGISTLDPEKSKAVLISQFLSRVVEGKHLDVQFETDEKLTPLETAAMVLNQVTEDDDDLKVLQEEVKTLVKVQAVAVCMEKGRFKLSSEVLDRQFEESETNKYLRMKMSMVVSKKDPYHEFLENFSYAKMLNKIKSYISLMLARRPPVFLLQAATKVVEAKGKLEVEENKVHKAGSSIRENKKQEVQTTDDNDDFQKENISTDECEETSEQNSSADLNQNEITEEAANTEKTERMQRRLFSFAQGTPWHPDKTHKRVKSKAIIGKQNCDTLRNVPSKQLETSVNSATTKKKQPWTQREDELLKKGVKKYGVGNWSKMLVHYEFNNRTGVMLKDRWRTMKKLNMVHDE
ncbi:telomeric repeat-binding factor 1 isoform X2 [Dendropsophus ebraccatus]|uniref:telomeric repeat-binding factor 1 isoform X2 n=1 Tax=Dendropsophus ebraccatus TaxID=150705 RepID=UPI003831E2B3